MKKYFIIGVALILLMPVYVFSDMVVFKIGYFIPRAQSDLWEIEFENMDFSRSDFQNTNFCFSYEYFINKQLSFSLGIDSYSNKESGFYEGYVAETIGGIDYAFDYGQGRGVSHVFSVSVTPLQGSLKLTPLGRGRKFSPFIGGGVGLYLWHARLYGEMIDFSNEVEFYDPNIDEYVFGYEVYSTDAREENKFSVGYHVFGGLMWPLANRLGLEVEFKYNQVQGKFTKAFQGFEPFDLSGYQISLGLDYWF